MAPPSDTNNQIDASVNTTSTAAASTGADTGTNTSTSELDTANADGNNRNLPNEEKSRQQHPRSTWDHDWVENNPFTLFSRYADEQISSMLQAVVGLPSAFEPPAAGNWLYFEEQGPTVVSRSRNADGDGDQSNGGSQESKVNDSGDRSWYDATQSKPHRQDGRDNSRQDLHNEDRMRRHSFNDLFEDTREWLGRPFHVSFFDSPLFDWPLRSSAWIHSHLFPNYFDSIISSHGPGWALPYILFSPYSPIHLERHEQRGRKPRGHLESWFGTADSEDTQVATTTSTPDWRLAFEDLLRIEAGKSMLDVSSKEVFKKESGADWIYGMIDRGSLGDQWKLQRRRGRHGEDLVSLSYEDDRSKRNWEASSSRRGGGDGANDNDSDTTTELDLYDSTVQVSGNVEQPSDYTKKNNRSFADMIEEKAKALKDSALSRTDKQNTSETSSQAQPAKVVSTMVSTERKTMPDGSIHSKTTRTKRYSDGREEKSEWVETTNPRDDGNNNDNDKNNGRNGWFW